MRSSLTILLIAGIGSTATFPAAAATDGQAGPTSQGSLEISLQVPPQIRLSGLQDVALVSQASRPARAQTEFCVYSRTGQYQLAASGSGAGSSFHLSQQGAGNNPTSRPYAIWVDDGSGRQPVLSGVVVTGLHGADSQSVSCDTTGPNAQLGVSSTSEPGTLQQTGTYQGTLTLTVAPE